LALNYSQEEVEQIARGFITKHASAVGDIDTLEIGDKNVDRDYDLLYK